jgi:hypothetical protein
MQMTALGTGGYAFRGVTSIMAPVDYRYWSWSSYCYLCSVYIIIVRIVPFFDDNDDGLLLLLLLLLLSEKSILDDI